ncbi:MAG TPA: dTDP-4-dehydrorhamnose reductase [Polyangia bacterium]|nr:dTDP-4-dehydrorhamnose reductase [Polyangia bacterium]
MAPAREPLAVVLGAGGLLGAALVRALPRHGWRVAAAAGRAECDIRDEGAVRALLADALGGRAGVVFNAAAFTDVERSEGEGDLAFAVNAEAVGGLARATREVGAALVHYSTDFVFDGARAGRYVESDPVGPLSVYARSKVEGERRAAAGTTRAFVVRVGGLYGPGGRNFPSRILPRLRAGETIRADRDRWSAPSWVDDVARVSGDLARTEAYGLYHCMAHGETTWAGFAQHLARELGLPEDRVEVVSNAALPLKAKRPPRALLENRALAALGLDTMPEWQEGARRFVASLA